MRKKERRLEKTTRSADATKFLEQPQRGAEEGDGSSLVSGGGVDRDKSEEGCDTKSGLEIDHTEE